MDTDDTIKLIVSIFSLAWSVYSPFAPYLNEFWKGFSLGAALVIFAAIVASYLQSRYQDTKREKSFPCSKCQREISVKAPRDTTYTALNPKECEHNDSIKVEPECPHCKTKHVRYWDRDHQTPVGARRVLS